MVNTKDSTSEKDTPEKKKRKLSDPIILTKHQKEDNYDNIIGHEEQEANKRSPEKDMALFHHTCQELKKIFEEVATFKKDNSEKARDEIQEKRIQGSLIFVLLKKLNRLDKIRLRSGRDALHKEKLRVDSNRLQLQNLLYESNHLKREVQRCYQFKSHDEEIDLVSEDEFYKNAPETISRPDLTKNDDHFRRLARLEWELSERKQLSALCKELKISKEFASKDILLKTERLNSLPPYLDGLLKATKPLQMALNMNFEKNWEIQKSARLLPSPLYLLYANLSAYSETCMKSKLTVIIEGDEDEAKQLEMSESKEQEIEEENQESDIEEVELDISERKKHNRLSKEDESSNNRLINLIKPHPLSVVFKINDFKTNSSISVVVYYLPVLDFVTIKPQISVQNAGVAAGDVIACESVLNCLYPNDFGNESPNPKTKYQLIDYGFNEEKLMELISKSNIGKPYKWAQKLCGLEFVVSAELEQQPSSSSSLINFQRTRILHELAQDSVISIIKLIRLRWQSRFKLYKQILVLENKNFISLSNALENFGNSNDDDDCEDENDADNSEPEEYSGSDGILNTGSLPIRISSNLLQWTSITWDEYSHPKNLVTQKIIEENLINCNDIFYKAIIVRGSAKLECLISISANFPIQSPIWSLYLSWNGKFSSLNNTAIRDMEYWVNSINITSKLKKKQKSLLLNSSILPIQLKRVLTCLDVFLETEGQFHIPIEFTQEKTFLKEFHGRRRSYPYKVVQNGGSVFFKQI